MSGPHGPFTGRPPTLATRGMVAAPHSLASATGLAALRRGGSAVDALIAANATLCVAYPHMAGLGGDGFWLIHDPDEGDTAALNASGPAARVATRSYYRERGHTERIPRRGPLAALTVPGAVDGWRAAHERYGRLPWESLFEDAVGYARGGVPVGRSFSYTAARDASLLEQNPSAAQIFLPGGRRPRMGERLAQEELAGSLERVARRGARAGFYEGETAQRICDALAPEGSPLRPDDFAAFRAEWTEPIRTTYRGREICEFPPNTQGFAALEALNLIEGWDVAAWGDGTADYYHHLAEALKLALADRDAWCADPRFVRIPVQRLVSKSYAEEQRRRIDPVRALPIRGLEPGVPFDPGARRATGDGGDTCYFCAVDEDGLVASAIQSIYKAFGSAAVAEGTGVVLQNRGACFSLDERAANRLEPGKRTAHTLIPALMLEDGEPRLAFGTMGGNGQPQTHAALVTRLVDFGYDAQQAVEAPRWVVGRTLGRPQANLWLEGRVSDAVAHDLKKRGQPVRMLEDWDEGMGHAQAIRVHRERGLLEGGADPRGDGAALGY